MVLIEGNYWYELNSWGYVEFEDMEDAEMGYDNCLDLIIAHPRWFLDNMDYIKEFEVPWLNYASRDTCKKQGRFYAVSAPRNKEKEKPL